MAAHRARRDRWIVAAVLGLAFVLRVGLALNESGTYEPKTDALAFDIHATSIAQGDGMGDSIQPPMIGPTAFRAPGWPYVLAGVYVIFGDHAYGTALVVNALLGVVVVSLIGLVGLQLMGRTTALVAMAIAAVHPAMIMTGAGLQLEPLLVSLCLGSLAAALQHRRSPRGLLWPVVAGVLIGLAVLTREQALLFIPSIAWLLWAAPRTDEARPRRIAPLAAVLVAGLTIMPWTVRNVVVLDAVVPLGTSAGFGLVGTYNETSEARSSNPGQWIPPYEDPAAAEILTELENPTEVRADAALRDYAIEVVRDHPTYPLRVAVWNTIRGFDLDGGTYTRLVAPFSPYPRRLVTPAIFGGLVMLGLALLGASTRRVRTVPFAVWAIPITLTAFMVVFLPFNIRYRASLEPFIVLLAAAAITTIWDHSTRRTSSGGPPQP